MTKILFVCHGNICRSTIAQCVMTQLVKARGLARPSARTASYYSIANPAQGQVLFDSSFGGCLHDSTFSRHSALVVVF